MRRLYSVLMFAFVMGAATTACTEEKAKNAPLDDPRVVAARQIYESAENSTVGTLTEKNRNITRCGQTEYLTVISNSNGTFSKFVWHGRIYGTTYTFRLYYDSDGQLRFSFISVVAANGTNAESRIYYDEHAKQIREEREPTDGPNHAFLEFGAKRAALTAFMARKAYATFYGNQFNVCGWQSGDPDLLAPHW